MNFGPQAEPGSSMAFFGSGPSTPAREAVHAAGISTLSFVMRRDAGRAAGPRYQNYTKIAECKDRLSSVQYLSF